MRILSSIDAATANATNPDDKEFIFGLIGARDGLVQRRSDRRAAPLAARRGARRARRDDGASAARRPRGEPLRNKWRAARTSAPRRGRGDVPLCSRDEPANHEVATSFNNLAKLLQAPEQARRGRADVRRAFAIRECARRAIRTRSSTTSRSDQKLDEAEPMYRRALAIKALGENPRLATASTTSSVSAQNKLGGRRCPQALRSRERARREHPDVATRRQPRGCCPEQARRRVDVRRALAILENALGENHPEVATSLNNLALAKPSKLARPSKPPRGQIVKNALGEPTGRGDLAATSRPARPEGSPTVEDGVVRSRKLGDQPPACDARRRREDKLRGRADVPPVREVRSAETDAARARNSRNCSTCASSRGRPGVGRHRRRRGTTR